MRNFQQNVTKLEAADTQVLGVSMDNPFANKVFADQNGVVFPLLSDIGGKVIREYGIYKEYDQFHSKIPAARRATYLIDKNGKVELVKYSCSTFTCADPSRSASLENTLLMRSRLTVAVLMLDIET